MLFATCVLPVLDSIYSAVSFDLFIISKFLYMISPLDKTKCIELPPFLKLPRKLSWNV